MTERKRPSGIYAAPAGHWVGDGFPVRSLLSPQRVGERASPFLLLDYAGPHEFAPADEPRGVGAHPHAGFETVTIVYQGEVEHRDSTGASGKIGPGDVQWMTAASGIVHEEMHSRRLTERGGPFEMVQLWVNLPAEHKRAPAGYQTLLDRDIPAVELPGGGRVRVIAGRLRGVAGPARTFTTMHVWDVRLPAGARAELDDVPGGWTAAVAVLRGELALDGGETVSETVGEAGLALFEREGEGIAVEARADTVFLLLAGEPIDEPVVSYGPFVMNTAAEIQAAVAEYQSGRMGRLGEEPGPR